ncbi:hypothetical protein [Longimicrobium sp.]|uniref:hypothetical protein n=1 Tax=Longimicrobium sp. TaxID=2029185 RepID=UPI002C50D53F|nr:hypothetical protein [Longimicrobium sp.]HSU13212.1 hypothetical protein [Longimicrobium sp.]
MLLIAGGEADFNVESIVTRMRERGMDGEVLRVGKSINPAVTWDFQRDRLKLDGREIHPSGVFLRYDVFSVLADNRPATQLRSQAWHITLHGWLLSHPGIRMLNRRYRGETNKAFILDLARRVGLAIPRTLITNELDELERRAGELGPMIAKPVPGGGYAQMVEDLLEKTERREGRSAAPAFVQQRLVPPEVRVYGVGAGERRRFVAFRVESTELDYRVDNESRVVHLPIGEVDAAAVAGLGRLMDALEMDYGAADFKADAETGELRFLEVNSGPMFAAFDAASGHAVSDAILDWLSG